MPRGTRSDCAFVAGLAGRLRARAWTPPLVLYAAVAAITLIPIVLIHGLKVEAPRQWNWVVTLPLAFAASHLLQADPSRRWATAALATSLGVTVLMRLYLVFWA